MHPYTSNDQKGRRMGRDDIHHETADIPRAGSRKVAKAARHSARQDARRDVRQQMHAMEADQREI